ncbi:MAG: 3-isopropylmalate dehydratase small subunit [Peptostreptococcaceae bacterium]|jgi:3-isopropylmalate/(R)-2-methylmalate dehydratase small subunit|nr:3-isopropylmalate dehydratase small subunit [Peptostreptococcaceae bacterium]
MFRGRVFKYEDNIDTDVIIPARYLNTFDKNILKNYAMIDIDNNFNKEVRENDIILAGDNFGCGSSREHAPIALKATGISCVIAKSFARIFYRNSFNIGLLILECRDIFEETHKYDVLEVDINSGIIKNLNSNKIYKFDKIPKFMQKLLDDGGLIEYSKK